MAGDKDKVSYESFRSALIDNVHVIEEHLPETLTGEARENAVSNLKELYISQQYASTPEGQRLWLREQSISGQLSQAISPNDSLNPERAREGRPVSEGRVMGDSNQSIGLARVVAEAKFDSDGNITGVSQLIGRRSNHETAHLMDGEHSSGWEWQEARESDKKHVKLLKDFLPKIMEDVDSKGGVQEQTKKSAEEYYLKNMSSIDKKLPDDLKSYLNNVSGKDLGEDYLDGYYQDIKETYGKTHKGRDISTITDVIQHDVSERVVDFAPGYYEVEGDPNSTEALRNNEAFAKFSDAAAVNLNPAGADFQGEPNPLTRLLMPNMDESFHDKALPNIERRAELKMAANRRDGLTPENPIARPLPEVPVLIGSASAPTPPTAPAVKRDLNNPAARRAPVAPAAPVTPVAQAQDPSPTDKLSPTRAELKASADTEIRRGFNAQELGGQERAEVKESLRIIHKHDPELLTEVRNKFGEEIDITANKDVETGLHSDSNGRNTLNIPQSHYEQTAFQRPDGSTRVLSGVEKLHIELSAGVGGTEEGLYKRTNDFSAKFSKEMGVGPLSLSPETPRIEHNVGQLSPENEVTSTHGQLRNETARSHYKHYLEPDNFNSSGDYQGRSSQFKGNNSIETDLRSIGEHDPMLMDQIASKHGHDIDIVSGGKDAEGNERGTGFFDQDNGRKALNIHPSTLEPSAFLADDGTAMELGVEEKLHANLALEFASSEQDLSDRFNKFSESLSEEAGVKPLRLTPESQGVESRFAIAEKSSLAGEQEVKSLDTNANKVKPENSTSAIENLPRHDGSVGPLKPEQTYSNNSAWKSAQQQDRSHFDLVAQGAYALDKKTSGRVENARMDPNATMEDYYQKNMKANYPDLPDNLQGYLSGVAGRDLGENYLERFYQDVDDAYQRTHPNANNPLSYGGDRVKAASDMVNFGADNANHNSFASKSVANSFEKFAAAEATNFGREGQGIDGKPNPTVGLLMPNMQNQLYNKSPLSYKSLPRYDDPSIVEQDAARIAAKTPEIGIKADGDTTALPSAKPVTNETPVIAQTDPADTVRPANREPGFGRNGDGVGLRPDNSVIPGAVPDYLPASQATNATVVAAGKQSESADVGDVSDISSTEVASEGAEASPKQSLLGKAGEARANILNTRITKGGSLGAAQDLKGLGLTNVYGGAKTLMDPNASKGDKVIAGTEVAAGVADTIVDLAATPGSKLAKKVPVVNGVVGVAESGARGFKAFDETEGTLADKSKAAATAGGTGLAQFAVNVATINSAGESMTTFEEVKRKGGGTGEALWEGAKATTIGSIGVNGVQLTKDIYGMAEEEKFHNEMMSGMQERGTDAVAAIDDSWKRPEVSLPGNSTLLQKASYAPGFNDRSETKSNMRNRDDPEWLASELSIMKEDGPDYMGLNVGGRENIWSDGELQSVPDSETVVAWSKEMKAAENDLAEYNERFAEHEFNREFVRPPVEPIPGLPAPEWESEMAPSDPFRTENYYSEVGAETTEENAPNSERSNVNQGNRSQGGNEQASANTQSNAEATAQRNPSGEAQTSRRGEIQQAARGNSTPTQTENPSAQESPTAPSESPASENTNAGNSARLASLDKTEKKGKAPEKEKTPATDEQKTAKELAELSKELQKKMEDPHKPAQPNGTDPDERPSALASNSESRNQSQGAEQIARA